MKVIKILSCLIILLTLSIANVAVSQQLPRSFRNIATGNTLVDELDLIYDPIELSFVDSVRLYTNLSNLTSGSEEFMNNISDNTFLLGISTPFPFYRDLKTSLLARYQNSTLPRGVAIDRDMDGYNDLFGEGDLKDRFDSYVDTDNDGLFNIRKQLDQEKHNNVANIQQDIYLTGSMPVGDLIVGGRLGYGKISSENSISRVSLGEYFMFGNGVNPNDPSFHRLMRMIDLEEDSTIDNYMEEGEFDNLDQSNYMGIGLSFMSVLDMPWGASEGRVDVGYLKTTDEINEDNVYRFQKDDSPVVSAYYKNKESSLVGETTEENNFRIGLGLKRVFRQANERRYDGFWRIGINYVMGSGNYDYTLKNPLYEKIVKPLNLTQYNMGLDSTFTDMLDQANFSVTDAGDIKSHTVSLSGHTQIPLGERVTFGMGVVYQWYSSNRETDYLDSYEYLSSFEILDDTLTANDYDETSSASVRYDRNYEIQWNRIEVPVGLEYVFTKNEKWRIRFGALFTYQQQIINDANNITDSQPLIKRTETGDGKVDIDIDLDDSEYMSSSEHSESVYTSTVYTYGLGYYPTPDLQIDLLGFWGTVNNSVLDTNFWRSLRLSMTIRL